MFAPTGTALQVMSLVAINAEDRREPIQVILGRGLVEVSHDVVRDICGGTSYRPRVYTLEQHTSESRPSVALTVREASAAPSPILVMHIGRLDARVRSVLGDFCDFLVIIPK